MSDRRRTRQHKVDRLETFILGVWTGWLLLGPLIYIGEKGINMEGSLQVGDATAALQQWEVITGFILPLVLSFIMQSGWKRATQALVAFITSLVVTVVQMYLRGDLNNLEDPVVSFLTVLALTIAFYQGFWKPTGVAPAIERVTTPRGGDGGDIYNRPAA